LMFSGIYNMTDSTNIQ